MEYEKMIETIFKSPKYLQWKKRVEANNNVIKNVKLLAAISRNEGKIYGIIIDVNLLTPEGVEMPRVVMICGDSVVIIPVLNCIDDGEVYTLLVEQRRVVDGNFTLEFPAGGIDILSNDPKAMTCIEIKEELGINVSPDELKPMSSCTVKVNPSILGDYAWFYYFEREVTLSFLNEIDGQNTGCHNENEYIKVRVQKMSEVANNMTSSSLIGIKLLEKTINRNF